MRLLYLLLIFISLPRTTKLDECKITKSKITCCINDHVSEPNCSDDIECPEGTRGKDCSETCPINFVGNNCSKVCDCSADNCHSQGCIETPEQMKTKYDKCINKKESFECCVNQRRSGDKCIDCWNGTFGMNCKYKCPKRRYGRFCLKKCNSSTGESCHSIIGCSECRRETYSKNCSFDNPDKIKINYDYCISKSKNSAPKCCPNQRELGIKCEDCWDGTFGENCKYHCPTGRYGHFCLGMCKCNPKETCHRIIGCYLNKSENFKSTDWKIYLGICFAVIFVIGFIGIIVTKRIKMLKQKNGKRLHEENFYLRETTPSTGIPRVKISEYTTLKAETANNFLHEPYNTLKEFKASSERRPS
uniref:Cell death abnormality protein 1-like n=1 Tax=Crassostrea virginica TaxID=6565 RepID=A0A8B8EZN9_CRAVI|nr:cell death abnormality protein 1-like [Crassostrea virginica]